MSELVRVRVGNTETNLSRAYAEANDIQILEDEATHHPDGRVRRATAKGGRPLKPRTTVDAAAATATPKKRAAKKAAAKKAAPAAPTTAATTAPASKAADPAETSKETQ